MKYTGMDWLASGDHSVDPTTIPGHLDGRGRCSAPSWGQSTCRWTPHHRCQVRRDRIWGHALGDEAGNRSLNEDVVLVGLARGVVSKKIEPLIEGCRTQIGVAQLPLNPIDGRGRLGDGRGTLSFNDASGGLTNEEEATNNENDEATRQSDSNRAQRQEDHHSRRGPVSHDGHQPGRRPRPARPARVISFPPQGC